MRNLFNPTDKQELLNKINSLTPNTQGQWGKMSVAQMLKHCTFPLQLALTNPKPPRQFIGRILGPLAKETVIGAKPFKRNSFTPKGFKVETEENFNIQKENLLSLINRFIPENVTDKVHPFFGSLSEEEWGQSQYKHLDHHLTQFGV